MVKITGPPPSIPSSFSLQLQTCLYQLPSSAQPAFLTSSWLRPLDQKGGWETIVPAMLELREGF